MNEIERFEAYIGTVQSHCRKGIYIALDEVDTSVFAFHGAPEGARVLISILRPGDPERDRLPLVKVESVLSLPDRGVCLTA